MKKTLAAIVLVLSSLLPMKAQFAVYGNEPASLRWRQIESPAYRFIYPENCDSLALNYAREWERYRRVLGADRIPYQIPVVLHPYSAVSNGFVVWTPSRMEMYTAPAMYSPEPLNWHRLLAIHEGRHVAQMAFLYEKPFSFTQNLFGELLAGPWSMYWSSSAFMEGDAVVAETALSDAGRGRSADFMEYFRVSFENGELRDYDRWRFGSNRRYTPDFYKVSYLSAAALGNGPHTESFDNSFRKRFSDFSTELQWEWVQETARRAPFQSYIQITENEEFYTSYSGLCVWQSKLYAQRSGLDKNSRIVSFDPQSGDSHLGALCGAESKLAAGKDRLYWSDSVPDERYEMLSTSVIFSYDGKRVRREIEGGRFYNPAAGEVNGEERLAVVENRSDGSSAVLVYKRDAKGTLLVTESYLAPAGVQPLEVLWMDGRLYASVITEHGQALAEVQKDFELIMEPTNAKLNHLFAQDGKIYFTSDKFSVNELFTFDPATGKVLQMTNLAQGGKDFTILDDKLFFTILSPNGRNICRSDIAGLPIKEVDWSLRPEHPMADSLRGRFEIGLINERPDTCLSAAKPYSKLKNALRIHSWAPLYIDYDELLSGSLQNITSDVGLGGTLFFQNDLSTFYGSLSYRAWTATTSWVPATELNLSYRGLYPVFDAKAILYTGGYFGRLRSYILLNFSANGWSRGIIPVCSYEFNSSQNILSASLRAYDILSQPRACILPRLGIGAEVGVQKYDLGEMKGLSFFLSAYGYLPGIKSTHSIAFNYNFSQMKGLNSLTVRYAMPFLYLDSAALAPLTYVKNFEFIPFYRYYDNILENVRAEHRAGAQLNVVLGNLLCLTYDFKLGLQYSYGTALGSIFELKMSYDL